MQKRFFTVMIAMVMIMALCSGCNNELTTPKQSTTATTTPIYRPTVPTMPLIDKDLTKLLTVEELTSAVGIPMQALTVTEQNSGLRSFSVESDRSRVIIDIKEGTREYFDTRVLPFYANLEACPNLGETAWFTYNPGVYNDQILVYNDGYMITVELAIEGYDDHTTNKLRCREIASRIVERL